MALKTIMLRRSIEKKQAELEALRQKDAEFSTREAELEAAINEAETSEQEQAVTEEVETFDADKTAHEAKKAALAGEIEGLEAELSEAEAAAPTRSKENHLTKERTERKMETNINIRALPMSRRAFDALPMEQRSEIVAREDVREFFVQLRSMKGQQRGVSGAELTIPVVFLDMIAENMYRYSKLLNRVRIRNVNTGTFIEADVQTPNGVVEYEGSARIDGVPGTAAPVALTFLNAAGTKTGKVFPTDNQIDYFDDVPVTCIDMAMPVVIIPAEYLGKTGYELPAELDADKTLLARIESIRLQAGKAMGLGDVSNMVIPKPVLISPAQKGGAINVRYFMPHSCHRALAITGAIAISSSCALEGTVTRQIVPSVGYGNINIEHPSGALDVHLSNEGQDATTLRASVIRTTRKIFSGEVYLP